MTAAQGKRREGNMSEYTDRVKRRPAEREGERARERISAYCTQGSPPREEGHPLPVRTPWNKVPEPALLWANNLFCSLLTKYEGTLTRGQKFNTPTPTKYLKQANKQTNK